MNHKENRFMENTPDWNNHPDKPNWFKNLEKARQKRHADLNDGEVLDEPHLWYEYCEDKSLTCNSKKGGRVLPHGKKPSRRSQMKLLLGENCYRVLKSPDDISEVLNSSGDVMGVFLSNGKIDMPDGRRISVHAFLTERESKV